jgi:hypothetical protein
MKKHITPVLLAGLTGATIVSCSKNNEEETKKFNKNNDAYTLETYEYHPFQYKITKYDSDKCKNQLYEFKNIKTYDVKCTPEEFKKYLNEENVTWDDVKQTINNSKFDEYHKELLLKGINNLQKNNFNIDLAPINYNLKNTNIKYKSKYEKDDVSGSFDCFNHEITILNNIEDKEKYEIVFLHEMLGHGMTDAYIEDSKIYCSIDQPVYIIDGENYMGSSIYGEAFEEATAQIIAITALDKQLSSKYMCAYDMNMIELLMFCEDNNCTIEEYANKGVDYLTKKMNMNNIYDPNGIISVITYNLSESKNIEVPSQQVLYEYFKEVVDDSYEEGKTFKQINERVSNAFNAANEYVMTNKNANGESFTGLDNDILNLTTLYSDIGAYAASYQKKLSK